MQKALYRLRTAAEMLDIPMKTLSLWCRQGRIKGTQIGKNWYLRAEEIERSAGFIVSAATNIKSVIDKLP